MKTALLGMEIVLSCQVVSVYSWRSIARKGIGMAYRKALVSVDGVGGQRVGARQELVGGGVELSTSDVAVDQEFVGVDDVGGLSIRQAGAGWSREAGWATTAATATAAATADRSGDSDGAGRWAVATGSHWCGSRWCWLASTWEGEGRLAWVGVGGGCRGGG